MEDKQIEERLQQIFRVQPLQAKCITYRTSTNEYRKMIRQGAVSELKNLVNVEMGIEQVQIKLPDEDNMPPPPIAIKKSKVESMLRECSALDECIMMLA